MDNQSSISKQERTFGQLRKCEVLQVLPPEQLALLAARCKALPVPKGGLLFSPGDAPAVYAVASGRVTIVARPGPGIEMHLFTRTAGQLFGEVSLFLGQQVNEARASPAALAVRVDAEALRAALARSPAATLALMALLAERVAAAEARVAEVAIRSVKERLRLFLRHLAADAGVADARGYLLPDRLTREEIAHLVGTSREAVSRGLGRLQREGEVVLSGRRIIVRQSGQQERINK